MRHEEIINFLTKLNSIFPMENKRVDTVFETYTDILLEKCLEKEYDLKKLLSKIVQTYRYTTFPSVKFILEYLPYAEIVRSTTSIANEGALIVLRLPNGLIYTFTVTNFGKNIKELKANYMKRFGDCEIKMYPKGTLLVGNEIIKP